MMPALLRGARVLLAPGHRSETFCLAAAEAIAMGVPVITRGIGALKERVRDGDTGYVCGSTAELARRTLALLTDDALWLRMQAEGLATRQNAGWDRIAQEWETLLVERNA
jgi:glycosyltransferase involved in cell wall biosynthesis